MCSKYPWEDGWFHYIVVLPTLSFALYLHEFPKIYEINAYERDVCHIPISSGSSPQPKKIGFQTWVGVRLYDQMWQVRIFWGRWMGKWRSSQPLFSLCFLLALRRLRVCVCQSCIHTRAHKRWSVLSCTSAWSGKEWAPSTAAWKLVSWMSSGPTYLTRPSASPACRVWNWPLESTWLSFTSGQIPLPWISLWWQFLL